MYDLFNQPAAQRQINIMPVPTQTEEQKELSAINGYIVMGNYLNAKKAEEAPEEPTTPEQTPGPAVNKISLAHHRELAYRAYSGISFSPEKRRDSVIAEFETMLTEDLQQVPEYYKEKYQSKFEGYFTAWLHSKSRCMSSMITGPANFPVRRMQKYNQWEDNKFNEFMIWRKRIVKAISRSERKKNGPTELEAAVKNLEDRKKAHEMMKAANGIIRKAKGKDMCIPALVAIGINEKDAYDILHPKFNYGQGYAHFYLTNNNASIKRLEDRVKMLQAKEVMKVKIEEGADIPEITINGAIIRKDFTDDRLKVIFDGKPADNVRKALKDHGFHWSRFLNAWCRKLTPNAWGAAKRICEQELKQLEEPTSK